MDAALIAPPRRLMRPIDNRWGKGQMAVLDFGDAKRPVDLIFVHANGFNAVTYRTLLAPLSASLRIWAPDLRGHGLSRLPTSAKGRRGWIDHRDDLISLLDGLDSPPLVMGGHSMGAVSSLLAAAERPERVSKLLLLEPVIWRRAAVLALNLPLLDKLPSRIPLVKNALKRRLTFASREAAMQAYRGRGAFKGWNDLQLADYLTDGLVESGEEVVLACAPATEAGNYAAQAHDPWRAMKRYRGPVRILKGGVNSTCQVAPNPRGLPNVTVDVVEGGTHFFPMLQPDITRDALFDAAV